MGSVHISTAIPNVEGFVGKSLHAVCVLPDSSGLEEAGPAPYLGGPWEFYTKEPSTYPNTSGLETSKISLYRWYKSRKVSSKSKRIEESERSLDNGKG